MATLQQQRQAIAAAMAQSRQATGAASRRATGAGIESERRGSQIAADLNQLQRAPRQRRALRTVPPVGAIPASRGRASYVPPVAPGGGIASPLTETPDTRTLHPVKTIFSSDGLLAFVFQRTATITMTDANNAEVLMEFADVP